MQSPKNVDKFLLRVARSWKNETGSSLWSDGLANGNVGCLYERLDDHAVVFVEIPLKLILKD